MRPWEQRWDGLLFTIRELMFFSQGAVDRGRGPG
jgi:hypothetical protein